MNREGNLDLTSLRIFIETALYEEFSEEFSVKDHHGVIISH